MSIRAAEQGTAVAGFGESDSFSLIDRHSNFDGTFRSDRDVRIEGEVKGTIECQGTLFVAQGANVTAKVEAENITVAGDLNGDIRCRGRLQLMPSGRVRGKVTTDTLVINEGAYYEGQLEMAPPEDRRGHNRRPLPPVRTAPVPLPPQTTEPRPAPQATNNHTQTTEPAEGSEGSANTFIRRFGGPETPWDARQQSGESEEGDKPNES